MPAEVPCQARHIYVFIFFFFSTTLSLCWSGDDLLFWGGQEASVTAASRLPRAMVTPDLEQAVAVGQSRSRQFRVNVSAEGALL